MATIAISDLRPAGYNLLSDSESFLSNLSDEKIYIQGGFGFSPLCHTSPLIKRTLLFDITPFLV